MQTQKHYYSISTAPQDFNAALIQEPQLCVHRDGRLSYRDLSGQWNRYVTEVPSEVYFKVPEHQRRRLFRDGLSGMRANGAQIVLVRIIRSKALPFLS
jgi:hypothetical protein